MDKVEYPKSFYKYCLDVHVPHPQQELCSLNSAHECHDVLMKCCTHWHHLTLYLCPHLHTRIQHVLLEHIHHLILHSVVLHICRYGYVHRSIYVYWLHILIVPTYFVQMSVADIFYNVDFLSFVIDGQTSIWRLTVSIVHTRPRMTIIHIGSPSDFIVYLLWSQPPLDVHLVRPNVVQVSALLPLDMHSDDVSPRYVLHIVVSNWHIVNSTGGDWLYLLYFPPDDLGVFLHITTMKDAALDDVVLDAVQNDATASVEEHAYFHYGLLVVGLDQLVSVQPGRRGNVLPMDEVWSTTQLFFIDFNNL